MQEIIDMMPKEQQDNVTLVFGMLDAIEENIKEALVSEGLEVVDTDGATLQAIKEQYLVYLGMNYPMLNTVEEVDRFYDECMIHYYEMMLELEKLVGDEQDEV